MYKYMNIFHINFVLVTLIHLFGINVLEKRIKKLKRKVEKILKVWKKLKI